MKKLLLVTLQGANIGNRLQNYALQRIFEKMGFKVFTPYYNIPQCDTFIKRSKLRVKSLLGALGIKKYSYEFIMAKRRLVFLRFDRKYIHNRFKISFSRRKAINTEKYAAAVCGSDQIWHKWSEDKNELRYFYLDFMPRDKRIAYAASFGFEAFEKEDIRLHREGINGIAFLSCRERSGQRLIKELTGRNAILAADPTLLISANEWKSIEKKPSFKFPERYILAYYLGGISEEAQNETKAFAQSRGLKIISIFDPVQMKYFYTSPDEFLWLVHHAEYVFTNSFHACAFSVIFQKRFMAFRRCEKGMEGMFDRIESLLESLDMGDCIFSGNITLLDQQSQNSDIDNKLEIIKKESLSFLKEGLKNHRR